MLDETAVSATLRDVEIRAERPADAAAIHDVVTTAFNVARHRSGTEATIVQALRDAGALTTSLVAEENGEVIGHVVFSPVEISGGAKNWFGLGPLAVRPDKQRMGIGHQLITAGLKQLRGSGAGGCVVLAIPPITGDLVLKSIHLSSIQTFRRKISNGLASAKRFLQVLSLINTVFR